VLRQLIDIPTRRQRVVRSYLQSADIGACAELKGELLSSMRKTSRRMDASKR
jgi:hypothetical protein